MWEKHYDAYTHIHHTHIHRDMYQWIHNWKRVMRCCKHFFFFLYYCWINEKHNLHMEIILCIWTTKIVDSIIYYIGKHKSSYYIICYIYMHLCAVECVFCSQFPHYKYFSTIQKKKTEEKIVFFLCFWEKIF